MQKIGIIGAEKEEINAFLELIDQYRIESYHNIDFYICDINNIEVVICLCGVGKVNAAIHTTLLIELFKVESIINIGSAGGLDTELNVNDIIISSKVAYYDVDVTAFGRKIGEVPYMPLYYNASDNLLIKCQKVLSDIKNKYYTGIIVSGDQFVNRKDQVDNIKSYFTNALCCDMEATGIAQTCYVLNIPFIIIRTISDVYGKEENKIQFDLFLKVASKTSAKICYNLLKII